jgi:hypothetical protein
VHFKLKKVRQFLKGWGYNHASQLKKEERNRREVKEPGGGRRIGLSSRLRNFLRIELMQMLDEEEVHWFRRCNETWFLKGDNSTKFFHRTANGRK